MFSLGYRSYCFLLFIKFINNWNLQLFFFLCSFRLLQFSRIQTTSVLFNKFHKELQIIFKHNFFALVNSIYKRIKVSFNFLIFHNFLKSKRKIQISIWNLRYGKNRINISQFNFRFWILSSTNVIYSLFKNNALRIFLILHS